MKVSENKNVLDSGDKNVQISEQNLVYNFRQKLPAMMPSKTNFSVWHFLKQCVGKELSKITMPVIFNEPISFLQRLSEYMEYSQLINEAVAETNPIKRMEKVSAFAVSVVSSNWERVGKPFNPLLGETYELHTPNFKWISEQVSHHPPISAFRAESKLFKFSGSIHPKLKFWGKSVEITPKGNVTLELIPWGETYTWQNVMCIVHNVIIGKIWIEHSGMMSIVNHSNNLVSEINFNSTGWFRKNIHGVEAHIFYSKNNVKGVQRKLYGKWTEALFSVDPQFWKDDLHECKRHSLKKEGSTDLMNVDDPLPFDNTPCDLQIPNQILIWKANQRPSLSDEYYNFTYFTMGLNQTNETLKELLAPTDSRFRKDIRFMEEGLINEASDAKNHLENKQRAKYGPIKPHSRKNLIHTMSLPSAVPQENCKLGDVVEAPVWFKESLNPFTNKIEWLYKGGYWNRDWSLCPDIF